MFYERVRNILGKTAYAYTTSLVGTVVKTDTYSYGDSNWKDKLTAYNGTTITYDVIGNPLNDGTWTYSWQAGRQLKSMTKPGANISYAYSADGLRARKTVNSTVTNYTLHGKNIVHMVQGGNTLHFYYDAQNRPSVVDFNGVKYGYLHNLQGDIIAVVDQNGNTVVEYRYDPWGKPLYKAGNFASTLGTLNPFRYRGYVYDEETGLYATATRYYNPAWGRFINADTVLGKIGGVLTHNLFAYCVNNPINLADSTGEVPRVLGVEVPYYGYFHVEVQHAIVFMYQDGGMQMEVPIKGLKKRIELRMGNEIWEIKPVSLAAMALPQAIDYQMTALTADKSEILVLGGDLGLPRSIPSAMPGVTICLWQYGPVILYKPVMTVPIKESQPQENEERSYPYARQMEYARGLGYSMPSNFFWYGLAGGVIGIGLAMYPPALVFVAP